MDATAPHPALDPTIAWPTLGMWVRWEGERLDLVSLAPARGATADQVLLPCTPELLRQLGKISLGGSRAGLYAARRTKDGADHRLVLCQRGWEGAVRISGAVSSIAEPLYGKTRPCSRQAGSREPRTTRPGQRSGAPWPVNC